MAASLAAFATRDDLERDMRGANPTATQMAMVGQYEAATSRGHALTMIIHETFGGMSPESVRLLGYLAKMHGAKLGADELSAPWCARSFRSLHAMRISIAVHIGAATEVIDLAQQDTAVASS